MHRLLNFALVTCFCSLLLDAVNIPREQRSTTSRVTVKVTDSSKYVKSKRSVNQAISISVKAENRNREEVNIEVTVYLIAKNRKGQYKLIHSESITDNLKKSSKENDVGSISYNYKMLSAKNKEPVASRSLFKYQGVIAVIKGSDGKIISIEGDFAKLYKVIGNKSNNTIFNSKGDIVD